MQDNSPKGRSKFVSGLATGDIDDDAVDSVFDLYTRDRSSCASEDVASAETNRLRRSIYRALACENNCVSYVRTSRTPQPTTTTRSLRISVPPSRPPRPEDSALAWNKNSSGTLWTEVNLDKRPPKSPIESPARQGSESGLSASYSPANMSDTTELGVYSQISLEKGTRPPPGPIGFWHKSLRNERRYVLSRWALMTLILSVFILVVMSLFWAVVTNVDAQMDRLNVYVVNFEQQVDALVGPIVAAVTESMAKNSIEVHLGFQTMSPQVFNNDPLAVREAIWQEEAWAAIVVNANATQMLRQAVILGNSSYDPNGAIQIIYNEARQQDLYFDHIYPLMQIAFTRITTSFGTTWSKELMSPNSTISKSNLTIVPQALNPGIGFSTYQLRPFLPHTGIPAVSIGLIYLIIISFFSFSFYLPIHMRLMKGPGHPPIKFWQFILWRWIATVMAYFFLSLAYSVVSLAFGFPFGNSPGSHLISESTPSKFYDGTFVVYWMINFFGMIALGLACENMAMFLGTPWTALWLIFWVITNVSTAFYEISLESYFYNWGYVWPLHNIVEASRTTLFDLKSHLAINFGVLIAWMVVNTAIFPFAALSMKWKGKREAMRAAAAALAKGGT